MKLTITVIRKSFSLRKLVPKFLIRKVKWVSPFVEHKQNYQELVKKVHQKRMLMNLILVLKTIIKKILFQKLIIN